MRQNEKYISPMMPTCRQSQRISHWLGFLLIAILPLLLNGCYQWELKADPPEPLRAPKLAPEDGRVRPAALPDTDKSTQGALPETRFTVVPTPPSGPRVAGSKYQKQIPELAGGPLSFNLEGLPLPAFINELYGNLLGLSFEISPDLKNKKDLVTLRISDPLARDDLYPLAGRVLNSYGVEVVQQENLLRFVRARGKAGSDPPLLVSGRTLPDVPINHRPIFQIVHLYSVSANKVRGWINQAYEGQGLVVQGDQEQSHLIINGPPRVVAQAVEAVGLFDQPGLRGRYSVRIEPVFQSPVQLADALIQVLRGEGYAASDSPEKGAVLILPLEQVNAVLVFTGDRALLKHVRRWAKTLDQPSKTATSGNLFYYPVANTRASELQQSLSPILQQVSGAVAKGKEYRANQAATSLSGETLVVDESRNGLLFFGQADTWARLLPVIRQMDTPAKQVLIEVTIAEVTLSDSDHFGIEWLINSTIGGYSSSMGTLGGLGVGGESGLAGGFTYTLASAGQTRLALTALATDQRINILSSPRIMVKSGAEASIEVGTEVPVVTSQSTATDLSVGDGATSSPSILQNIQYRKTGTLLTVKPIIHSGRWIDLEVNQEISAAEVNQTSGLDSPSILTRKVKTSLSLRDGGSVLLGGLISSNGTVGEKGVPYLRKLPLLGGLFRSNSKSETRTELLLLIVPYIIDDADEAEAITQTFRERLQGEPEAAQTLGAKIP